MAFELNSMPSKCFLCGSEKDLTKDHVPPKNLFRETNPLACTFLLVLVTAIQLSAQQNSTNVIQHPVSPSGTNAVSQAELGVIKSKAEKGDAEAQFDLASPWMAI